MTSVVSRRSRRTLGVLMAAALVLVLAACGSSSDNSQENPGGTTVPTPSGSLPEFDATSDDPAVGMAMPEVQGKTFDGEPLAIENNGKPKVLLFVAHWCPHCQKEIPLLKEHFDSTPIPDGVEIITVSTAAQPGAENYPPSEWLEREGWAAPTIEDDEDNSIAAKFGLKSFPYFVSVDADGKVVERSSGELTTDQFDSLLARAQGQ